VKYFPRIGSFSKNLLNLSFNDESFFAIRTRIKIDIKSKLRIRKNVTKPFSIFVIFFSNIVAASPPKSINIFFNFGKTKTSMPIKTHKAVDSTIKGYSNALEILSLIFFFVSR